MDIEYVRSRFIKHFDGSTGAIYTSPGRINLIGEHTDYNGGFVFPGAVDKGIMAELKPNGTNKVRAYSINMKDMVEFGLNEEDAPRTSWARYIFGVCREMIKRGVEVKGFNTAFAGDVPLGAGMSSSAALESTYAYALNDLFGEGKVDKFELAKVGQATEHNYCGVKCGIMDQFASVFGKKDNLIRLDCRSLEYVYLNNFFSLFNSCTATMLTLVLDYHSLATAGWAYALLLHHAENALSGVGDITLTMTCWALLLLATSLGTTTATMWTRDIFANLELLCYTGVNLLECKFNFQTQVASAVLL